MSNGVRICAVEQASAAARVGIGPGSRLIAINGVVVRDWVDAMAHIKGEHFELTVQRVDGSRDVLTVEKPADEKLGLKIEEPESRLCNNRCVHCCYDQSPSSVSADLSVKEDDYRRSYIRGSFITTTNMVDEDFERIAEQRLSPLYVSIQSTEPTLRARMMGRTSPAPIMGRLRWLAMRAIELHAQIVICPGWNDGPELQRTVSELATLGPSLKSISVLPAWLTDHRADLPQLRAVTPDAARAVVDQAESLQRELFAEPTLLLADEWYLLAGEPCPDYSALSVLKELQNGVGLVSSFYRELDAVAAALPAALAQPRRVCALTGRWGAQVLSRLSDLLQTVAGLELEIRCLESSLFGGMITAAGLLGGACIVEGMRQAPGFHRYLVPAVALQSGAFLDGLSWESVQQAVDAEVVAVKPTAMAFVTHALGPAR